MMPFIFPIGGKIEEETSMGGIMRQRIREIVDEFDLPMYRLAQKCGIGTSTLYRLYDNPHQMPSTQTVAKLTKGLGITPNDIFKI
jgi:predicted transcriptional regulator